MRPDRTYKTVVDEIKAALAEAQRQHGRRRGNRATSVPSANGWAIPWNAGPIANSTAAPPPMEKSTCSQAAEFYDQARKVAPEWSDADRDGL